MCVFTLDRIGRRWTLYWGSVGQGIAMFLAGGFSRLAIDARADGNLSRADSFGAAAASMVFIFTSVFGATWLTGTSLPPYYPLSPMSHANTWEQSRGSIPQKSTPWLCEPAETPGAW